MNLAELRDAIASTIERVEEYGKRPEAVPVSLQLDRDDRTACGATDVEVVWDNDTMASGCVVSAEMGVFEAL